MSEIKNETREVQTASEHEFLTENEVALRLKVGLPTVRKLRKTGTLSCIKISRNCLRFLWTQVVIDLLATQSTEGRV